MSRILLLLILFSVATLALDGPILLDPKTGKVLNPIETPIPQKSGTNDLDDAARDNQSAPVAAPSVTATTKQAESSAANLGKAAKNLDANYLDMHARMQLQSTLLKMDQQMGQLAREVREGKLSAAAVPKLQQQLADTFKAQFQAPRTDTFVPIAPTRSSTSSPSPNRLNRRVASSPVPQTIRIEVAPAPQVESEVNDIIAPEQLEAVRNAVQAKLASGSPVTPSAVQNGVTVPATGAMVSSRAVMNEGNSSIRAETSPHVDISVQMVNVLEEPAEKQATRRQAELSTDAYGNPEDSVLEAPVLDGAEASGLMVEEASRPSRFQRALASLAPRKVLASFSQPIKVRNPFRAKALKGSEDEEGINFLWIVAIVFLAFALGIYSRRSKSPKAIVPEIILKEAEKASVPDVFYEGDTQTVMVKRSGR